MCVCRSQEAPSLCTYATSYVSVCYMCVCRSQEAPSLCTWLRERFFGTLELRDHKHYADVWALDAKNDEHTGASSVRPMRERMLPHT